MRLDKCPDTVYGWHGPANAQGRCPWCGKKWLPATAAAPRSYERSGLTDAYSRTYDPDWDALTYDEVRRRYQSGMA